MEEIDSGSSLPKMIGEILTFTAMLGGVEVECLVNTGSMVTLTSESNYKQKLESVCDGVQGGGKMLTRHGCHGLEVPHLRYQSWMCM